MMIAEQDTVVEDTPEVPEVEAPAIPTELMNELRLAASDFHTAEREFDTASEIAKARKKCMEAAQMRLNGVVDRITATVGPLPLFEAAAEAWRDVRLDSLEPAISPRYLAAMAEHEPPLETLGQLTDWQREKADFWAADIKGIGEAAQGEIAAATEAYWAANPPEDTTGDD